ncbi:related to TAN1 - putative tRNA acetyltransferase [Melanopsichium pennsylvanicum]|uniref:Thump domain-containing proteins n=2 Tax=Melanopsichium pennsylvanicum TaxID=63383 RepID=A0A077R440_9BASI|nr:thump domain-containing proteins [Melanopsichium pennsylvanicum 4]SNX83785.1 related to TAN1 - putative tRNA acetyltransferase [Melanopsichium pennsylvanicum]
MPSKRKRSGPGYSRDDPSSLKRNKTAYNPHVYRVPSKAISGPGIFVTCVQGKERKAALQFVDILNEVADRLYPGIAPQPFVEAPSTTAQNGVNGWEGHEEEEDMDALRNGVTFTSTNLSIADAAAAELSKSESSQDKNQVKQIQEKERVEDSDDIAAQIAAELNDIRASEKASRQHSHLKKGSSSSHKNLQRFRTIETDTECFLFISVSPPFDPYLLVYTILSDTLESGEPRSRFVQRLTPVSSTCSANIQDLTFLAERILPKYFGKSKQQAKTFKIDPRIRSHSKLKRGDVIQVVASSIPTESEEGMRIHQANLTNPDLWIVVEVVKNTAAISVIENYEKFKKMNLQSVAATANEVKAKQIESNSGHDVGKGRIGASLVKVVKEPNAAIAVIAVKGEVEGGEIQNSGVQNVDDNKDEKEETERKTEEVAQKELAQISTQTDTHGDQLSNFRLF